MHAKFSDALYERVCVAVGPGDVVRTVANAKPNRIIEVSRDGIVVETERAKERGEEPLVPAWMVQTAWDRLQKRGRLTNRELLDDLNVKRSSFVCALLAQFPDVDVVSTRPITLALRK